MKNSTPDYKRIYGDILKIKFPEKAAECQEILLRQKLSSIDIIRLNTIIFGNAKHRYAYNQKFKSYNKESIFHILEYQKKNKLNNTQTAMHFKMSRNTLAKWKNQFVVI